MKIFLVVLACILLTAFPARADIVLAFVGPLTGAAAMYGSVALEGAQQAIEDINQLGGVRGQKLVLKAYDDVCDPKQAVAIANRIAAENIRFVIQGDCSGSSIVAAKIFIDEGILVLASVASRPEYTDHGASTVFRVSYRDDQAVPVLLQAIQKRFSHKKLAIIHDQSAYGAGIAEDVRRGLNAIGIKEILLDGYDAANHDFSALVTHLKQAGAEAIFIGGYPVEIGIITRQLHDAGLNIPVIAGDLSDPVFWKITEKTGEGSLFVLPANPAESQGLSNLESHLKKKNLIYNQYTFYTYAAVQILASTLSKDPYAAASKVATYMHRDVFNTVLGRTRFDQNGDVDSARLVLYRWHGGKYEEVKE